MKNFYILFVTLFIAMASFAETTTVTNSGFTFMPENITINVGDTIVWDIAAQHNVLEVSMTDHSANNNTSNGGFSTPFSGGIVTGLAVGTYYYVCSPHASQSMKGTITVIEPILEVGELVKNHSIELYPNPVNDVLQLSNTEEYDIVEYKVLNVLGQILMSNSTNINSVNVSALQNGSYFIHLLDENEDSYVLPFVK